MLSDITLGQFFPGNSVLHRMDPRIKLILSILYIVGVFLAKNTYGFVILALFCALVVLLSRISVKVLIKSLKPIIILVLFTAVINLFFTNGKIPVFEWKFIHIYQEGIYYAVFMAIRIVCLLLGTSVILTYTTSPMALTDAIERLLSPLKKIHLPVHEFAMIMTIALRFIPTLIEETNKIMNAQKARGADFTSGGLIMRAKALVPILIPLFISAFRRADELATAMECRCYHGGDGRTRYKVLKIGAADIISLFVMTAFCAAIVLANIYFEGFSI